MSKKQMTKLQKTWVVQREVYDEGSSELELFKTKEGAIKHVEKITSEERPEKWYEWRREDDPNGERVDWQRGKIKNGCFVPDDTSYVARLADINP
jgi:hypothetical protein